MTRSWQLQTAKNRLSEVVDEAHRGKPQLITRRGKDMVVVLSVEHYKRLTEKAGRLIDVLRKAPKFRGGLRVERSTDAGRLVDL